MEKGFFKNYIVRMFTTAVILNIKINCISLFSPQTEGDSFTAVGSKYRMSSLF